MLTQSSVFGDVAFVIFFFFIDCELFCDAFNRTAASFGAVSRALSFATKSTLVHRQFFDAHTDKLFIFLLCFFFVVVGVGSK